MEIVFGVLIMAFVIFVAIKASSQAKQNHGKSYEQRRNEVFNRYEKRIEGYRESEKKKNAS